MRVGLVTATVASAVGLAAIGATAAVGAHHHRHVTPIVIRTNHKACKRTVINGIDDHGTSVGTTFCGRPKAFMRTKGGKITPFTLPPTDGKVVEASNIASNGIVALIGQRKRRSRATSYLVYKNGTVVPISDPAAGTHSTFVNAVNRHGVAVGNYCLNRKCSLQQAFIYRNGLFRDFSLHHKGAVFPNLGAVSDSGTLAGYFFQRPKGNIRGFVKRGHHVRVVDAPKAGRTIGQGTYLLASANNGAICGDVARKHHRTVAFVERRGHMHLLDLHPTQRKSYTELLACNSHGEVGGHSYNTHTKLSEGFLAKVR